MDRRRETGRGQDWGGGSAERSSCVECGAEDLKRDMYSSEAGVVCASCFSSGEGQIVVHTDRSTTQRLARPLVYTALVWMPVLGLLEWTGWVGSLLVLAWITATAVALCATPMLLVHIVGQARVDWRRADLDPSARWVLAATHLWHAAVFTASLVLAMSLPGWLGLLT